MIDGKTITDWEQVPVIFDIPMACRLTGKSHDSVKKLCQKGAVPSFKVGKEWRFSKTEFRAWMEGQMHPAIVQLGA